MKIIFIEIWLLITILTIALFCGLAVEQAWGEEPQKYITLRFVDGKCFKLYYMETIERGRVYDSWVEDKIPCPEKKKPDCRTEIYYFKISLNPQHYGQTIVFGKEIVPYKGFEVFDYEDGVIYFKRQLCE